MTSTEPDPSPDLDLLRAFRAGDATTDDAARADARSRLLERTAAAAAVPPGAGRPTAPPARVSRPARRTRRRFGLALAAAAITAGAVGIGFGGSGEVGPSYGPRLVSTLAAVPTASAGDTLRAAADAAVGQQAVPFGPGSAWVVKTRGAELLVGNRDGLGDARGKDGYAAVVSRAETSTTDFDGRVNVSVEPIGAPRFTAPASEAGYAEAGSPTLLSGGDYPVIFGGEGSATPFQFGNRQLSYAQLLALPTDTASLRDLIREAAGTTDQDGVPSGGGDFAQVRVIAELMTRAPLPPELRGALWRAAASLPSIKLIGATTDPAGRPGTGITVTAGNDRTEIVFSPETGMIMSDWVYRVAAITSCDRDLDPCDPRTRPTDRRGRAWKVLAAPGSVQIGRTVLSAEVVGDR